MKVHLYKLFRFFLIAITILLLIDFSLGKVMGTLYNRMNVGEKARANYFIRRDTSSVVIFGSSRALYHYHSKVIADSLGLSVYNAGRSNQSIIYHLALLQGIVERHPPKTVVLDLKEDEFVKSPYKYEVLSALLPYCNTNEGIREIYLRANPNYKYWSWSHLLPYNSSVFATLYRGLKRGKDKDIRGFMPLDGTFKDERKISKNCGTSSLPIDTVLVTCFHDFVKLCKEKNIELFVTISPRYSRYECVRPELSSVLEAAQKSNVAVHDFSEVIDDKTLFYDLWHLNKKGALVYSQKLAAELKLKSATD
ncbi:hypothetical protein [Pseudochryseolinea flava]|uniref:SGNH/GDSL hydrolase family protein n=1 Tax=Pseudochryseolinea flava TaxID=2059302 RepID=A0A364Y313_9BACT|nr:hypothetical protein [Pseudochryseolinea flava]RAW01293.1 hypothetical protein DQQ10_10310 [Pseudochryseolinea flava]